LGTPYWKLQLPETLKAGAFETWVPKLELGNQRELRVLRAFVVIVFKYYRITISG
jgi:hypothetical protein